ncbi:MAG: PorP/SprF family type IX secretion system membrane protein [Brumimicrobium sp.]
MNKALLIVFMMFFCYVFSNAQQVPFYNHNMINPFVYNPAMAGYSGDMNAYVVRNQRYMGYGTGAINNMLSLEGKFFIPNSGIGLNIAHNAVGIQQQLSASLSYSYNLKIDESNFLRFGVSGGYLDNRINTSDIDVSQGDDPFLVGLRPNVASYDFNFGLMYTWNEDTRIGISIPQLVGNKVKYSKEDTRGYYSLARHFMGTVEHDFRFFEDDKIVFTPQALVRFVPGAPFQYDITAHINHNDYGWFSATYKSDYAAQFNIGLHVKERIHVGYSYEYVLSSFKNYYSGVNHEFLLGYTFKSDKVKEVQVQDPKLLEENDRLSRKLKEKEREIEKKDSLFEEEVERRVEEELRKRLAEELEKRKEEEPTVEEEPVTEEEEKEIREAIGYHFVETDGSDSPDGYYVVVGVYSTDKNTKKNLSRAKELFPDSYVVINQSNGYNYIVIEYDTRRKPAFNALYKFRETTDESVWILKYRK